MNSVEAHLVVVLAAAAYALGLVQGVLAERQDELAPGPTNMHALEQEIQRSGLNRRR